MKGHQQIIDKLNTLLTCELTAADQYFIHSRLYEDLGLQSLYDRISHEMQEELEHADVLLKRILFLEGQPNVGSRDPLNVGRTVEEMLQSDLDVEYSVQAMLKETMALCEELKDYVTRDELQKLLYDTEADHIYWLEQQLRLIKMVGLPNYLQSRMPPGPEATA